MVHAAPRLGLPRSNNACEWPNHGGPAPAHGPSCVHFAALLDGWLPAINQGLSNTLSGAAAEQLVFAAGDSLYVANRSSSSSSKGGYIGGRWGFYWTRPENASRLEACRPGRFVAALLSTAEAARAFVGASALSEERLAIPEPLLADAARASTLLARATYSGLRPHYGLGPTYVQIENDAFPPTTLAMARTLAAVGLPLGC